MSYQQSPWGNYQFAPGPSSPRQYQPQPDPVDKNAYLALGLGLGSIVLSCCPLPGAVMGVFAVFYGWNAAQSDNATNKILGILGLAFGVLGVIASAGMFVLNLVLMVNNR